MARRASRSGPLLAQAAQAARRCPDRLAPVLAAYRARHGLSEPALAARLGCRLAQLHGLALCRRPALDSPAFAAEVQALAAGLGCDAGRLTALLAELAIAETRSSDAEGGGLP